MSLRIRFYGAAENVTGSCYLLEACGRRVLIDCGLYQERELKARNWQPFPFEASELDAVVLTHAHLDHCGRLPLLRRAGYTGPVYCTRATAGIARIVLLDCAKINEEDAEFKRQRHERENRRPEHPEVPLYTVDEANEVLPQLTPWDFGQPLELGPGLTVEFVYIAHILGAAALRFTAEEGGETRRVVFSGDVGRCDMPILKDPLAIGGADYIVCESTYGDRQHGAPADIPGELADVVNDTERRGGNLIIPSFAIERTQELLFYLGRLLKEGRIPHLRTFVDSPMAVKVSDVFKRHAYLFDKETLALARQARMPGLTMVRTRADSKAINHIKGTVIVIAGSGMCTGGRIKHHLAHNIEDPSSTVLFVGYQAEGTLGRLILEGANPVRILGEEHRVRARVARLDGFSAHADREELRKWLSTCTRLPRRLFVTHGEHEAAHSFASYIGERLGWPVAVPSYGETAELE
ncbi:MAG: MBL fold metallo-hydrolase RNA specificity domain-containing protein [Oligosphaeraceae bacterium]